MYLFNIYYWKFKKPEKLLLLGSRVAGWSVPTLYCDYSGVDGHVLFLNKTIYRFFNLMILSAASVQCTEIIVRLLYQFL